MSSAVPFTLHPPRRDRAKALNDLTPEEFAKGQRERIKKSNEYVDLASRTKDRYHVHRKAYCAYIRRLYESTHGSNMTEDELKELCWPVENSQCLYWKFSDQLNGFIEYQLETMLPRDRRSNVINSKTTQSYIQSMLFWSTQENINKEMTPPDFPSLTFIMRRAAKATYEKLGQESSVDVYIAPRKAKTWLTREELAVILSEDLHDVTCMESTEGMQLALVISRATACRPSSLGPEHRLKNRRPLDFLAWRDIEIERDMNKPFAFTRRMKQVEMEELDVILNANGTDCVDGWDILRLWMILYTSVMRS